MKSKKNCAFLTLIDDFYSLIASSFLRFMRTSYRLTTNLRKLTFF